MVELVCFLVVSGHRFSQRLIDWISDERNCASASSRRTLRWPFENVHWCGQQHRWRKIHSFIHFIHSSYFCSTSASPLLLRGAADTARITVIVSVIVILCQSFTLKRHRQLRVKDLPKVPTWQPERDSKPWPFRTKGVESTNEPSWLGLWKTV